MKKDFKLLLILCRFEFIGLQTSLFMATGIARLVTVEEPPFPFDVLLFLAAIIGPTGITVARENDPVMDAETNLYEPEGPWVY